MPALPKPMKGAYLLAKREVRRAQKRHEEREMQAAKRRDGGKCRWPGCTFDLPIDPCHRRDEHRGAGGNPSGDRTQRRFIIALCRRHHGLYDHFDIDIEVLSAEQYFDGPCAFYRMNEETGRLEHYATETAIGVSVAVGA